MYINKQFPDMFWLALGRNVQAAISANYVLENTSKFM